MAESDVGMILSSIVEETRVIHNPFDPNAYSFDRYAHTNYSVMKHISSCISYGNYFFYNLDKFFAKSFNYTTKDNSECNNRFE